MRPDYVVAFVATEGHSDPVTETPPHFGLDVISANNPAAHGPGGGLWALLPDGQVKKLFPLPEHENIADLFDTPLGQLEKGVVVEPNMSEDGKTLYFAYFHDATWKPNGGGWQSMKVSYKGADLYRMNVGRLLEDFNVDPATLSVKRLTFKQYTGPAKSDVFQTTQDKFSQAINPSLPGNSLLSYWGTADIHLIEMRTNTGLKAVWSSNRTRTGNSNPWITDANHNFSLYMADILPDGSLGSPRQLQYYTTSNRTDLSFLSNEGYWTTGPRRKKESVELIGTFSTIDENAADQSFMARIPADTPFEFHLLEKNYGDEPRRRAELALTEAARDTQRLRRLPSARGRLRHPLRGNRGIAEGAYGHDADDAVRRVRRRLQADDGGLQHTHGPAPRMDPGHLAPVQPALQPLPRLDRLVQHSSADGLRLCRRGERLHRDAGAQLR